MDNTLKGMGQKIRELREKKNLSLREAGEQLDMDYSYLGRVERGFVPSMKVIRKLAEFYGVDISFLVGSEVEVPDLKGKMQKWHSIIEESERKGYSPEDFERIIKTLDSINERKT